MDLSVDPAIYDGMESSVADPGFPRGAPILQGAPTYYFAKFSKKKHEIERI